MCGIAGILSETPRADLLERVHEMAGALLHRGPDQQDASGGEMLALGMNRLAIVDDREHDIPYTSEDGSVRLVYNGEVYNHLDVRRQFRQTHTLRSDSDAETVVHAYEEMGLSMLDEKLKQLPDFPEDQARLLKHMIVSHHGAREFGSPEPPKTIEAVLLNYIDEMDSRVNSIREYVAKDESDGSWTAYHRLLERHFYKKQQ